MPVLARAWQMLLKGLEEVQAAPSPIQAAEMVLVRLAYVADLPAPAELVRAVAAPRRRRPRRERGGNRASGDRTRSRRLRAPPPAARRAPHPLPPVGGDAPTAAGSASRVAAEPMPSLTPSVPAPSSGRARPGAAELCRGRRAVRQAARGADPLASVVASSISSRSSPAASSSARPRARRAISPTGSASCSASGPASAGWSRFREAEGEPTLREQEERRERRAAERGGGPPVGSGGARDLSRARRSPRCGSALPAAEPEADELSPGRSGGRSEHRRGRSMKNIGQLMKQAQADAGRRWPRCRRSSKPSR